MGLRRAWFEAGTTQSLHDSPQYGIQNRIGSIISLDDIAVACEEGSECAGVFRISIADTDVMRHRFILIAAKSKAPACVPCCDQAIGRSLNLQSIEMRQDGLQPIQDWRPDAQCFLALFTAEVGGDCQAKPISATDDCFVNSTKRILAADDA